MNALCVMSDTERLQLLREVTETTVYDEKKGESLNKWRRITLTMKKINDHLQYIEERLDEFCMIKNKEERGKIWIKLSMQELMTLVVGEIFIRKVRKLMGL